MKVKSIEDIAPDQIVKHALVQVSRERYIEKEREIKSIPDNREPYEKVAGRLVCNITEIMFQ